MTVQDILNRINSTKFQELIWIGKNYSVADLIKDLKELDMDIEDWIPSYNRKKKISLKEEMEIHYEDCYQL